MDCIKIIHFGPQIDLFSALGAGFAPKWLLWTPWRCSVSSKEPYHVPIATGQLAYVGVKVTMSLYLINTFSWQLGPQKRTSFDPKTPPLHLQPSEGPLLLCIVKSGVFGWQFLGMGIFWHSKHNFEPFLGEIYSEMVICSSKDLWGCGYAPLCDNCCTRSINGGVELSSNCKPGISSFKVVASLDQQWGIITWKIPS